MTCAFFFGVDVDLLGYFPHGVDAARLMPVRLKVSVFAGRVAERLKATSLVGEVKQCGARYESVSDLALSRTAVRRRGPLAIRACL